MSARQTLVVDTRPAVTVLPAQESGPSDRVVLDAIGEAVDGYRRAFGERLAEVWLHGSRATGRYGADSDVDLLAVLHTEGGRLADLKLMGSVNHPIWHTHGLTIDGHATSVDEFYNGADPFEHYARTEGIRVDATAVTVLPAQESGPSDRVVLDAIGEAVDGYRRAFGERLAEVWLHGSRATGRYGADSDVDLLAVLHTEGGRLADLKLMGSVNHPIWHTHGLTIDGHATSVDEFYNGADPFEHYARTEGIRVDATAVTVLPAQESGPSDRVVLDAIGEAVDGYRRAFGERLAEVWLHGSRATGRYGADSDVDLLAVLHTEGGRLADLRLMGSVNHPIWHTHGLTIDGHATSVDEFYNGADPFEHYARTEGIRVDATAWSSVSRVRSAERRRPDIRPRLAGHGRLRPLYPGKLRRSVLRGRGATGQPRDEGRNPTSVCGPVLSISPLPVLSLRTCPFACPICSIVVTRLRIGLPERGAGKKPSGSWQKRRAWLLTCWQLSNR